MPVVDIVKSKLSDYQFKDIEVRLAVSEIEQVIKNYCVIGDVPKELVFTWANMTVDLLLFEFHAKSNNNIGDEAASNSGEISSLSIGDTSISFGGTATNSERNRALNSHKPILDELTLNYQQQLNSFRRLVW